ncbi:DUF3313 domain-containing protein [Sphingomonas sp. NFX23]|uniref:DUF3313 domain-containing protein n=1 Tax=Sphingomonas sp. NFX23 TaxID=2819532 RepID=UPI003CF1F579
MMLLPLVSACSTGGQKITSSGFLHDNSQLSKVQSRKNTALWVAPGIDLSRYDEVVVDIPEWHAAPRDAEIQSKLLNEFRGQLIAELATRYRVVDRVGTNTLRIRSALTNVRRTRWYLNVPAQAASFALGGLGVFAPLQGGASEEMQVQAGKSGTVLIQMATYRNGKPWNVKGSYVAYDHARMAFKGAAGQLNRILESPYDEQK